jgi:hypothetical protein
MMEAETRAIDSKEKGGAEMMYVETMAVDRKEKGGAEMT